MPHQCTNCGRSFEDGSKEMLSGCPDCGGNKFQFQPAGAVDGNTGDAGGTAPATAQKKAPENAESASAVGDASETGGDDRGGAVNRAAATVRDWVGTRDDTESSTSREEVEPSADPANADPSEARDAGGSTPADSTGNAASPAENSAQTSARRDVVSESELPEQSAEGAPSETPAADSDAEENVVDTPDEQDPGLEELRQELNNQFESIRIVEQGQYELNLMELYEREEYVISLKEDGKYVIEVPDAWDVTED